MEKITSKDKPAAITASGQRPLIHGLSAPELAAWIKNAGQPAFRAEQVWQWLYVKRVASWGEMRNIPSGLRTQLADAFDIVTGRTGAISGENGGTRKFIFNCKDGEAVEAVLIPTRKRRTVCISSQAGCRYRCAFCASGQHGLRRNLTPGEITGQLLAAAALDTQPLTHVVLMGIGEPLDNYDNVLKAIRIINDRQGLNIGARRITVSTCGLVPGIKRLAQEGLQIELSVSLHAANDGLRNSLMPVNKRYPLTILIPACRDYFTQTRRIITFEYALIKNINDSQTQARELIRLTRRAKARINLIPLNQVSGFKGTAPEPEVISRFARELESAGINTTIRQSRGNSISAACGQLRYAGKSQKETDL